MAQTGILRRQIPSSIAANRADSSGDVLRRGAAPADSTDGAPKKSDFPLSRGVPKSTRIQLGLKDRLIFWMMVAALHAFSLLPDFILYKLGVACGLIFHRFDSRHRRIGIRNLEIAFPEKSDAERRRILRASYINLGRTGAEYVRLGGFFYRRLRAPRHLQSARRLEQAARRSTPARARSS